MDTGQGTGQLSGPGFFSGMVEVGPQPGVQLILCKASCLSRCSSWATSGEWRRETWSGQIRAPKTTLPASGTASSWTWIVYTQKRLRRRQWQATPVLLPRKSHGRRSLVGCSPWGLSKSDTTERLHFNFSLSCIGEGNGNPLQCSCLENPRDGGACWAAVCGVA